MNITKEYFEKQLKKHDKVTVYSPENIPLNISKEFYVTRDGSTIEFEPRLRIDTPGEADYYRNGGILQYVLRSLVS